MISLYRSLGFLIMISVYRVLKKGQGFWGSIGSYIV